MEFFGTVEVLNRVGKANFRTPNLERNRQNAKNDERLFDGT